MLVISTLGSGTELQIKGNDVPDIEEKHHHQDV
jgi:hypothetical protein